VRASTVLVAKGAGLVAKGSGVPAGGRPEVRAEMADVGPPSLAQIISTAIQRTVDSREQVQETGQHTASAVSSGLHTRPSHP